MLVKKILKKSSNTEDILSTINLEGDSNPLNNAPIVTNTSKIGTTGNISFGLNAPTNYGNNEGIFIGYDSGPQLSIYSNEYNFLKWDGTRLLVQAINFTLDANGNITANNAYLSGSVVAKSGDIGGWIIGQETISSEDGTAVINSGSVSGSPSIYLGATGYKTGSGIWFGKDTDDVYKFFVGDTSGSNYIAFDGTTLDVKGIEAEIVSIENRVAVGATSPCIVINGIDKTIGTSDYISGSTGWQINSDGSAEFNNFTARGELKTFILSAENQMAVGGNIIISKDSGKLAVYVASSASVVDFGKSMTVGDYVKIQGPTSDVFGLTINGEEIMTVGSLESGSTVYNVTRGATAYTWEKDTPFAVLGQNGDSRIEMKAGTTGNISIIKQGGTVNSFTTEASMSSTEGAIVAGNGAVKLDSSGITLDGNINQSIIQLINTDLQADGGVDKFVVQTETIQSSGETRIFQIGMESNGTNAEAVLSYYEPGASITIPNGNFSSGSVDWSYVAGGEKWTLLGNTVYANSTAVIYNQVWNGGDLYVSGVFGYGAEAYNHLFFKYNSSASTWSGVQTTNPTDVYYDMKFDGIGNIWFAGYTTIKSGNKAVFTKYNISASSITRIQMNDFGSFYALDIDTSTNDVFFGGYNTAGNSNIVKWTSATSSSAVWGSNLTGVNGYVTGLKIIGTNIYAAGSWSYSVGVRKAALSTGSFGSYSSGMSNHLRGLTIVGTKLYAYGYDGLWVSDTSTSSVWSQKFTLPLQFGAGFTTYDTSDVLYFTTQNSPYSIVTYKISTNTQSYYGDSSTNGTYTFFALSYNSKLYMYRRNETDSKIISIYYPGVSSWSTSGSYASIVSLFPQTTNPQFKTLITSGSNARIQVSNGQNYIWSADTYANIASSASAAIVVNLSYYAAATGGSATATDVLVSRTGTSELNWLTSKALHSAKNTYVEISAYITTDYGQITAGFDNFTVEAASTSSLTFKDDGLYYEDTSGNIFQIGATSLNDLTDVVITTPSEGESLVYNGSEWVNKIPTPDTSYMLTASTECWQKDDPPYGSFTMSAGGTVDNLAGAAGHPGIIKVSSIATNNTGGGIQVGKADNIIVLGGVEEWQAIIRPLSANSNVNGMIGFMNNSGASVTPNEALAVKFTGNGTTWNLAFLSRIGGSGSATNFTTLSVNTWYRIKMTNGGTGAVNVYVYNSSGTLLASYNYTGSVTTTAVNYTLKAYRANNVATDLMEIDRADVYAFAGYAR